MISNNLKDNLYRVFLCLFLLLILIIVFILSSVPPISRDALVHHLAVPKLYIEARKIIELPCMSYSYFPMNLDMLYLIPLYFGNDIIPKFIHFSFALFTSFLIYNYLKKRLDKNYSIFGAFLFLSVPIIIKLSITVYVDLGLLFFSASSLILLFEWVNSKFKLKYLVFSGVFCGLAMGTKYNGLITFFIISMFVPFFYSRFSGVKKYISLKSCSFGIFFVFIALAVFSPWMARNYIWKGNPVYPLYNKYFNIKNENLCKVHEGIVYEESLGINLFKKRELFYNETPLDMALLPVRIFFQGKDNDFQFFDGKLSALLFFLPIIAFIPYGKKDEFEYEKKAMLIFSALFFFFAFFSSVVRIRYFAPVISFLVILSVFGIKKFNLIVSEKFKKYKKFLFPLFYGSIALYLIIYNGGYIKHQFEYVKPFKYINGELSRTQYISMFRKEYPAFEFINENLPETSNILFFYLGKRGYYCDRNYVPDEGRSIFFLYYLVRTFENADDISKELEKRGVTHFLFNNKFVKERIAEDLKNKETEILLNFINLNTKKMYDDFGFSLYEIK
ncbi:MAG: glycosyltransferase family 39 protein [Desulforegulaceae bacterium]|nr:glycosyltransferase family 39 protein [Desulforegulaceae bacterium]